MLWTKKNFIVDCLCLNGAFVPEIRGGRAGCAIAATAQVSRICGCACNPGYGRYA